MVDQRLPTRKQAYLRCALAAVTIVVCAGLFVAAVLAQAPAGVLPLLSLICIGCPVLMALELPSAIAVARSHGDPVADLRKQLAQLPETAHPLERG